MTHMNPSHMTLEDLTNKFVEKVKYLATDRTCEELRQTLQKVQADVAVSVETLNADLDEVRRRLDVYDNTFDGSEGSIDHVLREHARVLQEATERIERVETTLRDTEVAVKGLELSQAGVVYDRTPSPELPSLPPGTAGPPAAPPGRPGP
jgi:archaellum component FlaC